MRYSELASRYAGAIFSLASQSKEQQEYLTCLRTLANTFAANKEIAMFVHSPLVIAAEKEQVLKKALDKENLPENCLNFLLVLAKKNRLLLLDQIVVAFEARIDADNQVVRGEVRSSMAMNNKQIEGLEKKISQHLKKKATLTFKEDPSLIGGAVAQVGSLTFDDSLSAHLTRIKDDLTRRVH